MNQRIHASATLEPLGLPPREAFERVRSMGYPFVQLAATQPGLRPRELGPSARRDLLATLRRLELVCSGIDLWIPAEHFADPVRIDRAVAATHETLHLAHDLGGVAVSMMLPVEERSGDALDSIATSALRFGVPLADFAADHTSRDGVGIGIDPPAILSRGADPVDAVTGAGPSLIAARLSDLTTSGMRAPVGEVHGRLELDAYLASLRVVGHNKPVIADARQWVDPARGLDRTASLIAQHSIEYRI